MTFFCLSLTDVFEDFVTRKASGVEASPFLAVIWLHTVHEPHPSLPEFYHNYTDAFGDAAGDYLGTLTQMDVQIGRFREILKNNNVYENTMVWCVNCDTLKVLTVWALTVCPGQVHCR